MTKEELNKFIGKRVRIIFLDSQRETGILGFAADFSSKYGYKKPGLYYINDLSFRAGIVKKIEEV